MKVFRSFKVEFTCPDDWTEQRIVEECDKFDAGEISDKIEELLEDNDVHEDVVIDVEVIL